jgi:hypothetical protein
LLYASLINNESGMTKLMLSQHDREHFDMKVMRIEAMWLLYASLLNMKESKEKSIT